MVKYSFAAVVAVFLTGCHIAHAFVPPKASTSRVRLVDGETSLNAAPTFIIGPMIKKMREEQAKKKIPMASEDEQIQEAPGLRVGSNAWKWPPVWPYDRDFFIPKADLIKKNQPDLASMAGMLGGMPQMPSAAVEEEANEDTFDALQYWGEEVTTVTTDMDEEAVEKLKSHYSFYLKDGQSVLELGAAENSYLPDGLKLARHVGVGANQQLMDQNLALSESYVVDLNDVEPDEGVKSDVLKGLGSDTFDVILMTNTVDFLMNPRETFRSAWYLLKPGGTMIVAFSNKDAYKQKFERAQTKMWRDFNDDQHMWVTGSFFEFSAGEGWQGVKGFDISPESAKEMDDGPFSFLNRGKNNNMYVVQGTKGVPDDTIDATDPEKSFRSKMWMLPVMESRDKTLVAPRLRRAYEAATTEEERTSLGINVDFLPALYESLIKMDQFAFTFNMQAQLAVDVVADPDFKANDEQINALKQGLGLKTPSPEFWAPVGQMTSGMTPEDKINLLAHVVPRFGSGDPEQEAALDAFVSGMKPTFAAIRSKCPDMAEGDVQLLGTELLAAEILKPGRSSREEFAAWLGAMSDTEMKKILKARKAFKETADTELEEYRVAQAKRQTELEELQRKMEQQQEEARKERTMALNPKTGKLEMIKKEEK